MFPNRGLKKRRKGAISEMMIGGIGAVAVDEEGGRCWVIATLELSRVELSFMSSTIRPRHFELGLWRPSDDRCAPIRYHRPMS